MATNEEIPKRRGPIIDPALCRCCRSIKKCRLLTVEYQWMGKPEVYSDLIVDCFGLVLSHLDGDSVDSCICATCVTRLREANAFRCQVLSAERAFLQAVCAQRDEGEQKFEIEIKNEPLHPSDCEDAPRGLHDAACDVSDDDHKAESPAKIENDFPKQPSKTENKISNVEFKPKGVVSNNTASDDDIPLAKITKKEIETKIERLKEKMDRKLEKRVPTKPKQKKQIKKAKTKKNSYSDHDKMIQDNIVTIVQCSYVCPFLTRVSNYYCFYCKDQFTDPTELREHTLKHDPNDYQNMIEQKKVQKIDITRIDCRLCADTIDDVNKLKQHITSVHKKVLHPLTNEFLKFKLTLNSLTCTECSEVFPYFDSLKKHMNSHFGNYVCDICGACFLEQGSLSTHIRSHNKLETNFPCEICGKNLKSKYSRYLHIATVHEKKATVNCYKCDESFLSYALRNKHLIEVHGDKRTFPCKLCDKVYNRRKTLMEHNRRNHLKVFRHHCDLCDQKFYLPSRLKEHLASHTGERKYKCNFCDKSYPRWQSLQEHTRSHSDRDLKCGVCNLNFTQSGSLKYHMKTQHSGVCFN